MIQGFGSFLCYSSCWELASSGAFNCPRLHLPDWEFRLCLQYWLEVLMLEEGSKCFVCQVVTDCFGDHQVSCGDNGDHIHHHDSLRDALFSAVQLAALAPRREVPSLIPGISSDPADLLIPSWNHIRPAALDVIIISPVQSSQLKVRLLIKALQWDLERKESELLMGMLVTLLGSHLFL